MSEYHKIDSVFKRNPDNMKTFLMGEYSTPEFEYLANNEWEFTEKVDGTNIRVVVVPASRNIGFFGRTDAAVIPGFLLSALHAIFEPVAEQLFDEFPSGAVLYGEGYGPKIQKGGGNYRKDPGFVLFDVWGGQWWLHRWDVENIAHRFSLDVVPVIGRGTLHDAVRMAQNGFKSTWGDFQGEGIVARPVVEMYGRGGRRIITKVKCRDFARVPVAV